MPTLGLIIAAILSVPALVYLACAVAFLLPRRSPSEGTPVRPVPPEAITVLVPARNEGPVAVRALRSVLEQDYAGPVSACLLVAGEHDSTIPYLRLAYPSADFDRAAGSLVEVFAEGSRRLTVLYAGLDGKAEKINAALALIEAPLVAILDADHQAKAGWLSAAETRLRHSGAAVVQSRRGPLSAGGFFQLWDSLQQHVGCEMFNALYARLGLTVFFTGSTALMRTALLREFGFRKCLTEDTDLSYRLVLAGHRIAYEGQSGSDEEVSPDLFSFMARRRRWANGHTQAFLQSLRAFPRAPLSPLARLQFLFHGTHYLIGPLLLVLHLVIAGATLPFLSAWDIGGAAVVAALATAWIVRGQGTRRRREAVADGAITFLWFVSVALISVRLLSGLPALFSATPSAWFFAACTLAPLALVLAGLTGFGQGTFASLLVVTLTYPLAFLLDVTGTLLGLSDFAHRSQFWRVVARESRAEGLRTAARGIRDSWNWRAVARSASAPGSRLAYAAPLLLLVIGTSIKPYESAPEPFQGQCQLLPQDKEPWYLPSRKLGALCDAPRKPKRAAKYTHLIYQDEFQSVDPKTWTKLDSSWDCNLAQFVPAQAATLAGGGLALGLANLPTAGKKYASASVATGDDNTGKYLYGRYEAVMKPAKGSGLVSAFFLYRYNPWQEIDVEFVGRDTTRLLLNVFFNPGEVGDEFNHGKLGTPVVVDLGFDASKDFHHYAVEWEPKEIRWYVDGKLVHRRFAGTPSPIPNLPMQVHLNVWPTCGESLAGKVDEAALPARAEVRSVAIYGAEPAKP